MSKQDLALNNLQELIFHKTELTLVTYCIKTDTKSGSGFKLNLLKMEKDPKE